MKTIVVGCPPDVEREVTEYLYAAGRKRDEVMVEPSAEEALEGCLTWQPEAMLLYVGISGMTLTEFLIALQGPDQVMPCAVVLLANQGREQEGFEVMNFGAQDCVSIEKTTAAGLNRAIWRAVERHSLQKRLHEQWKDLQRTNAELVQARDHLESEVQSRTADLARSNAHLKQEVIERQQIEANLRESQQRFMAMVSNVPGVIYSCTFEPPHKAIFVSSMVEKLTGIASQDFVMGHRSLWKDTVHEEDLKGLSERRLRQLENDGRFTLEYRICDAEGGIHWVVDRGQIVHHNDQLPTIEGFLFDNTELKELEEERLKSSKLESIGILAGGVAHDLNNILTAISANLSLATSQGTPMPEDSSELLSSAQEACGRAADLARQLLTFSKGGAPICDDVDLAQILVETASFVLHGSRSVLEHEVPDNLWAAHADRNQISQVVQNLVINAHQAMPGGGHIIIRARNERLQQRAEEMNLDEGRYVVFSVEDEGEGIPEGSLSKIFDPYFSSKASGSGLGLATTYSIISRHRGHIRVTSRQGKGAIFEVWLPAAKKEAVPIQAEHREGTLRGGYRVLVMDDTEPIRMAFKAILTKMGYTVELADSGETALNLLSQCEGSGKPVDVVLLDLTIPGGMGGKEVLPLLREVKPELIAVVVSGYSDDPVMSETQKHGFDEALPKPFTLDAVKEVFTRVELALMR